MTLPTIADADKEHGTVLLQRGVWGFVNAPWRDIKPGDVWKHGYQRERTEPRQEPTRNAWT